MKTTYGSEYFCERERERGGAADVGYEAKKMRHMCIAGTGILFAIVVLLWIGLFYVSTPLSNLCVEII